MVIGLLPYIYQGYEVKNAAGEVYKTWKGLESLPDLERYVKKAGNSISMGTQDFIDTGFKVGGEMYEVVADNKFCHHSSLENWLNGILPSDGINEPELLYFPFDMIYIGECVIK